MSPQLSNIGVSLRAHPDYPHLVSVSNTLIQSGFKAYIAGGAVRDLILGREPKDFDFATNATPEQIEALFEKTIPVGKKFGIIVVVVGSLSIEVATFRRDGEYVDGRRPESIEIASPEEDARRRDFTVNALFYDFQTDQVIDYVGGLKDIEQKLLRTVGDPQKRFSEDYLRILRLIRFSAELGFEIEPQSLEVSKALIPEVEKVSAERIRVEIVKALASPDSGRAYDLLNDSGLFDLLFVGIDWKSNEIKNQFTQMRKLDSSEETLWLGLFLTQPSSLVELELKKMKCSRAVMDSVLGVLKFWQDWTASKEPRRLSEWILRSFSLNRNRLLHFGQIQNLISVAELSEFKSWIELPEKLLSGDDFLKLGFQGAEIARLQKEIQCQQIEESITTKAEALEFIQNKKSLYS